MKNRKQDEAETLANLILEAVSHPALEQTLQIFNERHDEIFKRIETLGYFAFATLGVAPDAQWLNVQVIHREDLYRPITPQIREMLDGLPRKYLNLEVKLDYQEYTELS